MMESGRRTSERSRSENKEVVPDVVWDGIRRGTTLNAKERAFRAKLADAAKQGQWENLLALLRDAPECVNCTRPDGRSLYAPLHQAAFAGASETVVHRLVETGAWKTLQNVRGERPVDVAVRQGHRQLVGTLTPTLRYEVPTGVLLRIQEHFNAVIRSRAEHLVREHELRLPELQPLLELALPKMWFPVPGMYGGFSYWLEESGVNAKIVAESWCRVSEGSGQRHEITSKGSTLVGEGFV